jgi:Na+-transporting NADH:ubiquinone oxidoreductase subunit NqrC
VYRYPKRELGNGILEFSVMRGFINVRGDRKTSHTVTYFTSDDPNGDLNVDTITVGSFSWADFSWANFTWGVMGPLFNWVLVPFLKNIRWYAVEFSNNTPGTGMNISSMQWQYQTTRVIR